MFKKTDNKKVENEDGIRNMVAFVKALADIEKGLKELDEKRLYLEKVQEEAFQANKESTFRVIEAEKATKEVEAKEKAVDEKITAYTAMLLTINKEQAMLVKKQKDMQDWEQAAAKRDAEYAALLFTFEENKKAADEREAVLKEREVALEAKLAAFASI